MTHFLKLPEPDRAAVALLVTRSLRCWREACDASIPIQPHLSAMLHALDRTILAPVFDSLFSFVEAALQRPLAAGTTASLTEDERLLLDLVDRPDLCRATLGCPRGVAAGLTCALCSTRIMLALAQKEAATPARS